MTWDSFRMFAISIVLVAGLYLAWHFTHPPNHSCEWRGQQIHGSLCP